MVTNRRLSYRQMQALADRGDSLAALLIAKQLYAKPQLSNDALHYFTIAASAGRSGAVKPLVALVRRSKPTDANRKRLAAAEAALQAHAARGDDAAFEGLISAYRAGTPFENSAGKYAEFRAKAAAGGNATAALEEAISLISQDNAPTRKKDIEAYLLVAERSDDLKTQSVAGALRRKLAASDLSATKNLGASMSSIQRLRLPFALSFVWLTAFCLPASASDFGCSGLENDPLVASVEGKEGYFYRVLADIRMQHQLSDHTARQLADVAKALEANGTTLIYVPIPTKSLTMPEYLPDRTFQLGFNYDIAKAAYDDAWRSCAVTVC